MSDTMPIKKHLSIVSNLERERDEALEKLKPFENWCVSGLPKLKADYDENKLQKALYKERCEELQQSLAASQITISRQEKEITYLQSDQTVIEKDLREQLKASQAQVAELVKVLNAANTYCMSQSHSKNCTFREGECDCEYTRVNNLIEKALALTPSKALEKYQRMEEALKNLSLYKGSPVAASVHGDDWVSRIAQKALNYD